MWHYHCTPRRAVRPRELLMATHGPVKQKAPAFSCPSGIKDITAGYQVPAAPPFQQEPTGTHRSRRWWDRPATMAGPDRQGPDVTSYRLSPHSLRSPARVLKGLAATRPPGAVVILRPRPEPPGRVEGPARFRLGGQRDLRQPRSGVPAKGPCPWSWRPGQGAPAGSAAGCSRP
jgi:hypothetical protein